MLLLMTVAMIGIRLQEVWVRIGHPEEHFQARAGQCWGLYHPRKSNWLRLFIYPWLWFLYWQSIHSCPAERLFTLLWKRMVCANEPPFPLVTVSAFNFFLEPFAVWLTWHNGVDSAAITARTLTQIFTRCDQLRYRGVNSAEAAHEKRTKTRCA